MVQVLPMGVAQDEPVQQRPVHLVEGLWASFSGTSPSCCHTSSDKISSLCPLSSYSQ